MVLLQYEYSYCTYAALATTLILGIKLCQTVRIIQKCILQYNTVP